jgi:putative flippase GtrA
VGGLAYVIDAGGFNLLVYGPGHVLADVPVRAKILTGVVATLFAWFGNRYWTFAGKQTDKVWREFAAFVAANLVGVAIAAGCLWVSRWALDLHSGLADNISGNIVGTGLGTIFRYLCYRYVVFTGNREATAPRHG